MTNPDWTKAPEGATHYDPTARCSDSCWMIRIENNWKFWNIEDRWVDCTDFISTIVLDKLIQRPINTRNHISESIVVKSETIITIQTDYEHVDKVYVNGKLYAPEQDEEC